MSKNYKKRNADTIINTKSKKCKQNFIWNDINLTNEEIIELEQNIKDNNKNEIDKWVSATSVKNYLLNDPLIDWLKIYYKKNKYNLSSELSIKRHELLSFDNEDNKNILFDFGNKFEEKVYEELKVLSLTKCDEYKGNEKYLQILENDIHISKYKDINFLKLKYNDTKNAIKKGIPIITQAVLINENNYTYGIADILIRSDFINKFFTEKLSDDDLDVSAPKLNFNAHYRVIDIKWTTIKLCANGINLRNEGLIPAYKGQLAIYNAALGNIQGYIPNEAYILSKSWMIDSKNLPLKGYSCFDKLFTIDYLNFDNDYINKTILAIKWVQEVKTFGQNWNFDGNIITKKELYPNMCNKYSSDWDFIKKKISEKYGELTNIWYVNVKNRNIAHENNIYNIYDNNCCASLLGFNDGVRKDIIDSIISINQSNEVIFPKEITNDKTLKIISETKFDYYFDFETINGVLNENVDDIDIYNSKSDSDCIFMIGLGFKYDENIDSNQIINEINNKEYKCEIKLKKNKNWEYVCFYINFVSNKEEENLVHCFLKFLKLRYSILSNYYNEFENNRLFHWTGAEITNLRSFKSKTITNSDGEILNYNLNSLFEWLIKYSDFNDLYKLFLDNQIVINGCFNFKLKTIANGLYKKKLINTCWPNTDVKDGLSAMISAINCYKNSKNIKNNKNFKNIIDYNEIDCKSMLEIKEFLNETYN